MHLFPTEGPGMICLLQMNGVGDIKFLSSHKTEELAIERVLIAGDDDAQFVLYNAKNNEYSFGYTDGGWAFFWT